MHAPTSPDRAHPNGHTHSPTPPPGPDAKPQAPDGGRDGHGRFASGSRGGPGNPFARRVGALRKALLASVAARDMEGVARELVRQAQEGNLTAARLLLSYTLGKPAQTVDPDTLDLHEWELYRRLPDPGPEMLAATTRPGLPFALEYLRTVLPGVADDQLRQFCEAAAARKAEEERQAAAREERAARRQEKQAQRAAAGPTPPPAAEPPQPAAGPQPGAMTPEEAKILEALADDPEALAAFFPLLGAPGGPANPCQAVTPPSPNGVSPHGQPGGPQV
jgi:hypothetical protein